MTYHNYPLTGDYEKAPDVFTSEALNKSLAVTYFIPPIHGLHPFGAVVASLQRSNSLQENLSHSMFK